MRDAVGNIIEVRTVEPWGLHLLTATGSNGAPSRAEDEGDGGEIRGMRVAYLRRPNP